MSLLNSVRGIFSPDDEVPEVGILYCELDGGDLWLLLKTGRWIMIEDGHPIAQPHATWNSIVDNYGPLQVVVNPDNRVLSFL